MKHITALVLAAGLALSAGTATYAQMSDESVISMGHSMLLGGVFNSLRQHGFSTDGIENLTLEEVVELNRVLNSGDDEDQAQARVRLILERAQER